MVFLTVLAMQYPRRTDIMHKKLPQKAESGPTREPRIPEY